MREIGKEICQMLGNFSIKCTFLKEKFLSKV